MSDKYKYCNHHHDLTDRHRLVEIGGCEFVANVEAIHLLEALNNAGLKTRTHHHNEEGQSFISILLDNAQVEVKKVNEIDADRANYNGKYELLIWWRKGANQ